jgi:hypothetical protein
MEVTRAGSLAQFTGGILIFERFLIPHFRHKVDFLLPNEQQIQTEYNNKDSLILSMKSPITTLLCSLIFGVTALQAEQTTVTIAAVNNPDMLELKKLSSRFEQKNPNITLKWVIVEENILRQRVSTDVSTGSGQFDLVFIGLYETPLFAKRSWLPPIEGLSSEYDLDDVFKSLRDDLSFDGKLFALPFYGESSFLMYRKDLFEQKGLTMPDQPTFDDIAKNMFRNHDLVAPTRPLVKVALGNATLIVASTERALFISAQTRKLVADGARCIRIPIFHTMNCDSRMISSQQNT